MCPSTHDVCECVSVSSVECEPTVPQEYHLCLCEVSQVHRNHHTLHTPAWQSSSSVQTETSQSGVPWKLFPLAVNQQHCLEESCHPENGTSIVLVLPLSLQAPSPPPPPPPPPILTITSSTRLPHSPHQPARLRYVSNQQLLVHLFS